MNSLHHSTEAIKTAKAYTLGVYQPTAAEVVPLMDEARADWPQLVARTDKAQEILLSGGIGLEPVAWEKRCAPHWQIASQSKAGGSYIIPGGLMCHCDDRRAPVVGTRRMCKHQIAMAAYLRILRNRINADIRTFNVELSVLGNSELLAFAKGLGYVQMYNDGGVYKFSTQASPAHYSIWLRKWEDHRRWSHALAATYTPVEGFDAAELIDA